MNKNRDQNKKDQHVDPAKNEQRSNQRSGDFNETSNGEEKSTENMEEEADLEQQRKEALTERD